MLRTLFICSLLCLACQSSWCQDVITRSNGDTINAKVLRVSSYSIRYMRPGGTDTIEISLPISAVKCITYQNGTADTFSSYRNTDGTAQGSDAPASFIDMGREDATVYYRDYRAGKNAMIFSSIFMPGYSLVPTLIISNTRPKESNLGYPYPELMDNAEYRYAYQETAFQIKRRKTWNGFFLGTGIIAGVYAAALIAVVSAMNHR